MLGIPVNTGIDPTNAIAIGAAYFAATKEINLAEKPAERPGQPGALRVKVAYNRASQEREEMFRPKWRAMSTGLSYRITREDGGYDSGLKTLAARISEDLPLQEDAYNLFALKIYDAHNNPVPTDLDSIQIAQGKYSVAGQMLPHDLSLVLDDLDTGDTKLDCIFVKNSVIPAKTKKTVEVNRTVIHGSGDDAIRIIVVEGPSENHHTANRKQGELNIRGKQLKRDVPRGTEIDLTFELSESRDLTVTAYINPSGPDVLGGIPLERSQRGCRGTCGGSPYAWGSVRRGDGGGSRRARTTRLLRRFEKLRERNEEIHDEVMLTSLDDVTDDKIKLDDRKREIAQELGQLTAGKRMERLRADYQTAKDEVTGTINESGNDLERRQLRELVAREHTFLNSTNPKKLEEEIDNLRHVGFQILRRKPDFLIGVFQHLIERREVFNDQLQAKNLIEAGKRHMAAEDWDKLDEVIVCLWRLLPQEEKDSTEMRHYITGIS